VKDMEVDSGVIAGGVLIGDVEEAVDAEITRIAAETRSITKVLHDEGSRDTDENR
jgi:hypothetical protein